MAFVNHNIDPRDKDEEWIKSYIKAAWKDFVNLGTTYGKSFYNGRETAHDIVLNMMAQQSPTKYQKQLTPDDIADGNGPDERINWSIPAVASKYFRIAIEMLKNMRDDINVDVTDALAQDDQDDFYADVAAKIQLREMLKEQGVDPAIVGLPADMPQDMQELEMWMKFSYKHRAASEIETLLTVIMEDNRYDDIRDEALKDLFYHDAAVIREYRDHDNELIIENVDYDSFVTGWSKNSTFDDMEYAGEIKDMTVADIKSLLTNDKERREFDELKSMVDNDGLDSTLKAHGNQTFTNGNYKVLRMEFISSNSEKLEVRTTKDGRVVMNNKSKGNRNKEIIEAHYDVVYSGHWIVDTDFYFDLKLETNMKRDPKDLKRTRTSYHVVAPNMYRMRVNSLAQQMIPIIDMYCMTWFKLQNAILKSKPKGVMYELGAIQDLQFNEEEISMEENLLNYQMTGNFAYRRVNENGEDVSWSPITELKGGLGSEGDELFAMLDRYARQLGDIIGFNEITDGSSPNPKTLKSVAELSTLSSNNAIRYLHSAERKLNDMTMTDVMNRVQDLVEDGDLEQYKEAVGENSMNFFKDMEGKAWRKLGIYYEEKPSQEEQEKLTNYINLSIQKEDITAEDAIFIETIDNKKEAMANLSYRIARNRKIKSDEAKMMVKANAETQQQSITTKLKADMELEKLKSQNKINQIKAEGMIRLKEAQMKAQAAVAGENIKSTTRLEEVNTSSSSKETIADKNNETKSKAEN